MDSGREDTLQTIAGLRKEIEDLKSRVVTWIPVTERLPEKDGKYLFMLSSGYFHIDFFTRNRDKNNLDFRDRSLMATHWSPLPAGPEEEK